MRTRLLIPARLALLAGATGLAFFSGGYFSADREWAGLVAWLLLAMAALAGANPIPRDRAGRVALAGLAGLAAWTLLSITWAPIAGNAYQAGQIAVLYLGALMAAVALLREPGAARATEPMLALGALVVIGYGISERLLPGWLHFARSISAQGRLEQPLTYWNAMGELAAIGLVLCARLAGDQTRRPALRAIAAAAAAPLGMGLYLSFSRGALFAALAGLVALAVLAPTREQLRGGATAAGAAVLAAVASAPFHSVTALSGSSSTRERQGAIVLALLVAICLASAIVQRRLTRTPASGGFRLPRRAPLLALAVICAGLALAIVVGAKERSRQPLSGGATRLATLQSNRYAYWRVAFRAFRAEPIRGVGAGGWAVYWLRYRPFDEFAQDAHSLPLQTMAELGLVGLALLAAFLAGLALAAARTLRVDAGLVAGPIAAFVVYLAHAPLDWDWQMPAVTLVALICAGMLLAQSGVRAPRLSEAPRG